MLARCGELHHHVEVEIIGSNPIGPILFSDSLPFARSSSVTFISDPFVCFFMTKYIIVDSEGNEHTDPVGSKERADELLQRAEDEGTLNYSIKRIGRGFF